MLKQILLSVALTALAANSPAATVTNLRCEYLPEPVAIDAAQPRLSWLIASDKRGERQRAYQILVASASERLKKNKGDLWDSGKVVSDENVFVAYAGARLSSRAVCFWKVRVWDQAGKVSDWSSQASWTMGLLKPEDWSAKWISASRWFTQANLRPWGFTAGAGGWADVDLGAPLPIEAIKLYFYKTNTIPTRFRIEGSDEPQFYQPQILVDKTNFQMEGAGAQVFPVNGSVARHIRLRITGTPTNGLAIVRQMEVMSGGRNVALMRPAREFGFGVGWRSHAIFLVDGRPSADEGDQCPPDACSIATAPLLRKTFMVEQKVKHATLYVGALGMADVTVNGQPVTDAVLGPPFTDSTKRVVYLAHDITSLLGKGENVIGATLGNGFFSTPGGGFGSRFGGHGPPRVLIQTEIEYEDGTRQTINSDETWKWARSEIVCNDTFDGYIEDRRLAKPGWDRPGYDAAGWLPATIAPSLGGKLVAPMGPPIRVAGELKAERVEGNRAFFKTLTTGWPRVKVNGKAGQTITIRGHAPHYDAPRLTFTLATNGLNVLQPRFMYLSGPLDVEVEGLSEPLAADAVTIQLVHADLKSAGAFTSSNPFLNQIYETLLQTHLNYNGDQPMDPMREKQGWTQDMQGMFNTAAYLTDVAGLYHKWWWDFADGQDESGYVGSVLPLVGLQINDWNSPWWSGVLVLLPWEHYQYYGDRRVLEEAYGSMRRYVDFLGKLAASGPVQACQPPRPYGDYPYLNAGDPNSEEARGQMLSWMGAGDWMNPFGSKDAVPAPLLGMPAWYRYATIVSQTAALLGNQADAAKYAAMAEGVKDRFNGKYLNRDTGLYGSQTDSQTAQVLPLALNVAPKAQRQLTYQRLLDAIHARKDHLGSGFVGLPFLLQTLTEARETALANKMVNQQDFPSWKTLMHHGVLGEDWHGGGAQMPSCGGAIGMWLYQSVLGIRPDPAGAGFKKFILAPQPDPGTGLTSARGSYDSAHGRIVSDWKMEAGRFSLKATIPANTSATVYIPAQNENGALESGKPAARAKGVKFLRMEGGAAVYAVSSGTYEFTAESPGLN